ncbi:MAG: VOC family protein [Phycisphaerales bacterium]|nr:VOC family protein [Phycisphaerales bacterium]
MAGKVKAIPDGYNTLSPHIQVRGAGKAIEFYKKAFGAEEMFRMPGPDGKSIMHAELKIGNSMLMLCEEMPGGDGCACVSPQTTGKTTAVLHLYVEDADSLYNRAVKAGAKATMPLMDAFWGDRYGQVTDPFGHVWSIASHKRDLTPQQIEQGAQEFFASMCGKH